jgi:hypothetical protein
MSDGQPLVNPDGGAPNGQSAFPAQTDGRSPLLRWSQPCFLPAFSRLFGPETLPLPCLDTCLLVAKQPPDRHVA